MFFKLWNPPLVIQYKCNSKTSNRIFLICPSLFCKTFLLYVCLRFAYLFLYMFTNAVFLLFRFRSIIATKGVWNLYHYLFQYRWHPYSWLVHSTDKTHTYPQGSNNKNICSLLMMCVKFQLLPCVNKFYDFCKNSCYKYFSFANRINLLCFLSRQ